MKKYIVISLFVVGLSSYGYSAKISAKDAVYITIGVGGLATLAGLGAYVVKLTKESQKTNVENKQLKDLHGELSVKVDNLQRLSDVNLKKANGSESTINAIQFRQDKTLSSLASKVDGIEKTVGGLAGRQWVDSLTLSSKIDLNAVTIASLTTALDTADKKAVAHSVSAEGVEEKVNNLLDHQQATKEWIEHNVRKTQGQAFWGSKLHKFPLSKDTKLKPLMPVDESSYVNIEMSDVVE